MKPVLSLVAASLLFASFVQAESQSETSSTNQFGISFKSSDFGNDLSKQSGFDLKDIEEQFFNLGIHWGATKQLNEQQLTTRYVFLDYGNTEVTLFNAFAKVAITRQLAIAGVGQNFQYNLNDTFYVKAGAELGLYHDKFDLEVRLFGTEKENKSNTGALLAGSVAAGAMLSKHWDLELGYKYQYFASNKFDDVDFSKASQIFFGVNYNY